MSAFELVLVAFAIILGFGISEVLGGWGQQIRVRATRRPYPLQIASSGFILYFSLQYLWGLWLLRDLLWTFPVYLLLSLPPLALALAAHVTRVDVSADAPSASVQYFENARPVYILLTVMPISLLISSVIPEVRDQVRNAPNFVAIILVRVALAALILSLAWSKNARFHGVAIGVLWLTAGAIMIRLAFRLSGSVG